MEIDLGEGDKVLISRTKLCDLDYRGGSVVNDQRVCWMEFGSGVPRFSDQAQRHHINSASIKPAPLADGSLSDLPRYVIVEESCGKTFVRLPVLSERTRNRIPLGSFPNGNRNRIKVVLTDGAFAEFVDLKKRGPLYSGKRLHSVLVRYSAGLHIFRERMLKQWRKGRGAKQD